MVSLLSQTISGTNFVLADLSATFQLSDKYGIPFFETSAFSNINIENVSIINCKIFSHVTVEFHVQSSFKSLS